MTNEQVKALRLELQTTNGIDHWDERAKHRLFTKAFDTCVYPMFGKGNVEAVPALYAELAKRGESAWTAPSHFAVNMSK